METPLINPETDTVQTKFGELKISKFSDPVGFNVNLKPTGYTTSYEAEMGETFEASKDEFLEEFNAGGKPLMYICQSSEHAELMDEIKNLCQGTHLSYVIHKLKGIPR